VKLKVTHDYCRRANRRWKRWYGEDAPFLKKARKWTDAHISGIHLLNPTFDELQDAFCTAMKDNFKVIVVHTKRTLGRTA
jgi:hypothetical protein